MRGISFQPRRRRGTLRKVAIAVAGPVIVTLLAALPVEVSTTTAAIAYVLAVVAASALAGFRAGLAASVLSFLGLNFFFTPPFRTLRVGLAEDLVALVVFFLASAIVGTLLSAALDQRAVAERREGDARLLHHLSTRLLSGEPTEEVLRALASAIAERFDLARCEVRTGLTAGPIVAERPSDGTTGAPTELALSGRDANVGQLVVVPASPDAALSDEELDVVRTIAGQAALAIEASTLAGEADRARSDAETNRLRAALFSSVTHDLRTPLASITASVTSLLDEEAAFGEADRRELLQTIRAEAERLNRLVGNFLDLSRLRAGALQPSRSRVAIDELIGSVVARLEPRFEGREVRLLLREDLPEVAVDVVQIDQALTNVLENAARFAPRGSRIGVSASRWREHVVVRVSDQGPGIPVAERARVLEPFVRDPDSSGAGLGLAIATAIVESHGGRLSLEDTPGGGTTVVIELPVEG